MRTSTKEMSTRLTITRLFEASRHQGSTLASAFERALPVARRIVSQSLHNGVIASDGAPLRRRASS